MAQLVFMTVLPWLLVAAGFFVVLKLVGQNGRILLRLEAMEARLAQAAAGPAFAREAAEAPAPPRGLVVGAEAPAFDLPGLTVGRRSLARFRGTKTLLIFSSPQCGFCTRMLPDLAALPFDGAGGKPVPLVVTNGDARLNRRLIREHNFRGPVLLQKGMEVAEKYRVHGTPMGYLIDEEGRIASELAVGADALLALAGAGPAKADGGEGGGRARGPGDGSRGNRPLSTSRLVRDGLKAGTPAPDFRVPLVGGGAFAMAETRGRRVLLVFSDPHCGPCMQLAPVLEEKSRGARGVEVVVVSRGDVGENRAKVDEFGLTYPVGLQKNWDVSKLYGMFATPIAYLVDERGVIAADVAVGVEPILNLLAAASDDGAARRNGAALAAAGRP